MVFDPAYGGDLWANHVGPHHAKEQLRHKRGEVNYNLGREIQPPDNIDIVQYDRSVERVL